MLGFHGVELTYKASIDVENNPLLVVEGLGLKDILSLSIIRSPWSPPGRSPWEMMDEMLLNFVIWKHVMMSSEMLAGIWVCNQFRIKRN